MCNRPGKNERFLLNCACQNRWLGARKIAKMVDLARLSGEPRWGIDCCSWGGVMEVTARGLKNDGLSGGSGEWSPVGAYEGGCGVGVE